jgi:RimJ/RimL family protein N-acetyltransferase
MTQLALSLADGRTVRLQVLTAADAPALTEAIHGADSFDLFRRFMGAAPPAHVLVRLLSTADGIHDAVLGAYDVEERLVGIAQFDRTDDLPSAELAVEVATGWKRCGLGTALLHELAVMAAGRGITRLTAFYFTDNAPLIRLLHATGACTGTGGSDGTSSAELDVPTLLQLLRDRSVTPAGSGGAVSDAGAEQELHVADQPDLAGQP